MTTKQIDEMLQPIVDDLKKNFSGSTDYLSGVNDGMYAMGQFLIRQSEKAATES